MNSVSTSRSNYFAVKDRKAFDKEIASLPLDLAIVENEDGSGRVALLVEDEGGSFYYWDTDERDDPAIDPEEDEQHWVGDVIRKHLAPGETCVLMTVSAEGLRSMRGYACAFQDAGSILQVSLFDILDMAEKKFGKRPNPPEL